MQRLEQLKSGRLHLYTDLARSMLSKKIGSPGSMPAIHAVSRGGLHDGLAVLVLLGHDRRHRGDGRRAASPELDGHVHLATRDDPDGTHGCRQAL